MLSIKDPPHYKKLTQDESERMKTFFMQMDKKQQ